MKNKFRLGSDPEVMVTNDKGEIVSAIGLLPGTKEEPFYFKEGFAVQTDNVMAEFCVPPTDNPEEMYENIRYVMKEAQALLPQGYGFINKASHIFPDSELDNPQAKEFGCEPDYTPYDISSQLSFETTKERDEYIKYLEENGADVISLYGSNFPNINPKPQASNPNLRSCGGHIHIDTSESYSVHGLSGVNTYALRCLLVSLDQNVGTLSVLLDPDTRRRELYGKAGAFRIKPYGVEYRTLSNFWINDLNLIKLIYNQIDTAITKANDVQDYQDIVSGFIAINFNLPDVAKQLLHNVNLEPSKLVI